MLAPVKIEGADGGPIVVLPDTFLWQLLLGVCKWVIRCIFPIPCSGDVPGQPLCDQQACSQ
jgi:hypothetical protein